MRFAKSVIAALFSASILGACGGGGGGAASSPPPVSGSPPPVAPVPVVPVPVVPVPVAPVPETPAPPPLPATRVTGGSGPIEVMADEGKQASFVVSASVVAAAGDYMAMAVIDSKGLVIHNTGSSYNGLDEVSANVSTASALAPGEYQTTLELRVCRDDPLVCKSPIAGSPWTVALKLKAGAQGKLTTLAKIPGLQAWSTYNGNASHTGSVPADFAVSSFTRRWSVPGEGSTKAYPAVIDNGRIFLTRSDKANVWEILAIDEATGAIAWRRKLPDLYYINPPAAANGNVYFTSFGSGGTYFSVISQINGQSVVNVPILPAGIQSYMAPTIAGEMVYTPTGTNGLLKFNWKTSQVEWTTNLVQPMSYWTPAVDGSHAYVFLDKSLYALNSLDGSAAYNIVDQETTTFSSTAVTPVVGGGRAFVVKSDRVVAFDLEARTRAWTRVIGPGVQPALGNGALYSVTDAGVLEALEPATGARLWKSSFRMIDRGADYFRRVIVSNNLAFVIGWSRSVALDLTTHQVVWSYPLGGEPAISEQGVLYIVSEDGRLDAINLR